MKFFLNHPKKLSINFYNNIRKKIIDLYKKDPKLLAIYEYGSVRAPGISDLDIILVYINNCRVKKFKDEQKLKNNILLKNGTIIKTTKNIFSNFSYLDEFKLKKLYGKNIKINKVKKNNKYYLKLISVLDWLPERALRLVKLNSKKKINVNELLCLLYSITYSFKRLEIIKKRHNQVSRALIKKIKYIRKNWFKVKKRSFVLKELLKGFLFQIIKELWDYQKYLENKKVFILNKKNLKINLITLELFKKFKIAFIHEENYDNLIKLNRATIKKKRKKLFLPILLFSHFDIFFKSNGFIKDSFVSRVNAKTKIFKTNQKYRELLLNKIRLMNDNNYFLKINNFKNGLIRYGYYK